MTDMSDAFNRLPRKPGRPSEYSPVYLPAVKAAAFFGATITEIADYLGVPISSFSRWMVAEPELRDAIKRNTERADARVEERLYELAMSGNLGAICFWLKNRKPSEWRDVQNVDAAIGHYIISDRPLTEDEWVEERRKLIDTRALPQEAGSSEKPSSPNELEDTPHK